MAVRSTMLRTWALPAVCASAVAALTVGLFTAAPSAPGPARVPQFGAPPSGRPSPDPSADAEARRYAAALHACLARRGYKVTSMPEGGYQVGPYDDASALEQARSDCQAEQGVDTRPHP
jgi:hypothetical protein